jgi:hypothetical protein
MMRSRPLIAAATAAFLLGARAEFAAAQATPELPSSKAEVADALSHLRERYGRDAVRLESVLLQYAIEHGSVLTASGGIKGVEQHGGHSFLVVRLDTGIVYDPASVPPAECPARVWIDVIDPALRQLGGLDIPADGIALSVSYQHGSYADRSDLQRRLREGSLATEVMDLHMLSQDVLDMIGTRIGPGDLIARSELRLNGLPLELRLPEDAARGPDRPAAPPTPAVHLMPE